MVKGCERKTCYYLQPKKAPPTAEELAKYYQRENCDYTRVEDMYCMKAYRMWKKAERYPQTERKLWKSAMESSEAMLEKRETALLDMR